MNKRSLVKMGAAYGKSYVGYKFGHQPRPFSAAFALTNKCNLRCTYCLAPYTKTPELKLDQIEVLFSNLKDLGIVRLGIFGGEPMVRKDLGEVLQIAKSKGFFISLNTNLNLYSRYKEKLEPVEYFFTSLDGTPERHLKFRGGKSLDGVVEAIDDIVSRGKKMTAISVLTEPDFVSIDYLMDFAAKHKIDIHFQAECFDSEKAGRESSVMKYQDEMKGVWEYLLKLKKGGAPITTSKLSLEYLVNWEDYSKTSVYDPNVKCAAGKGFIFVETDGMAYPCAYIKGRSEVKGVNLLVDNWKEKFDGETPCTKCIVGPLLEFNLLYQKPMSSVIGAINKIQL